MTDISPKRTRRGRRGGGRGRTHCSNCGTRGPDPCSKACGDAIDTNPNYQGA